MGHLTAEDITRIAASASAAPGDETLHLLAKALDRPASALVSSTQTFPRAATTTAYTAGDVVSTAAGQLITFEMSRLRETGSDCLLLSAVLQIRVNAVPSGMSGFRLHLYKTAPAVIADNAVYNLPSADVAAYVGFIDLPTPQDFGDTLIAQATAIQLQATLASGGELYGILQTLGAYTPNSGTVYALTLSGLTP